MQPACELTVSSVVASRSRCQPLSPLARPTLETSRDVYQAYSGAAQLRYALARCCAVTADYDYYYYKLHDVVRPAGLPEEYDRNAIRVGLSLWLPLYGAVNGGGREGR